MTDPLTEITAHGLAMEPCSVALESIAETIQQSPPSILKVVRGPSGFHRREAEIEISTFTVVSSLTETL